MNILWVEDFGGGLAASESTVSELFRDLIDDKSIDDYWDSDQNLIDNNAYISEFFSEHSQFHKVHLCRNYRDFADFNNENIINKDIDLIIIDIRLDNNINAANALFPDNYSDAQNEFNLNAGFYIYNLLLQSGFLTDYMCLLTGEKNSYDEFRKNCKKLYLQEPVAFEKDEDGYQGIRRWISERKNLKRLQLKRGILDGLNECRKNLSEPFEFTNYFDDSHNNEKDAVNRVYLQNYLNSIESNINSKYFENTDIVKSLTLLVRSITHEWDNKIDPRISRFVYVLKETRNMMAHNNKLEIWHEDDAAILFLISMRHLVNYRRHPEIFPYEAKLLGLIRNTEKLSRKNIKGAILEDKKNFENLIFEKNIAFSWYISAIKELLDRNDINSNLLKERIYKAIWDKYDSYKEDNPTGSSIIRNTICKPDSDFKVQLFSALVAKYEN